ncbi:PilZ domain-containing protein [Oceanicoccus sagamiensis]|uniref:PilZ domain-containing protein n=1 Tax=Oceanicoccus sagamiensis TaxID=716816 RepID=A0A1X9NDG0_9GAMM|nr:PilZ domain-containing protein [Oceanicoccus sagamiensis]ARN76070.1 hypothetical protein BST96_19405 [Oceanicoccus sagamiensis]
MRRFARHPTDIPIDVKVTVLPQTANPACSMTTVSQGGLSCEVDCKVAVGSIVDIQIDSVSPVYQGSGEVVWCREKGESYEVGVRFTNNEEAFKSRMVQQVCQIEQYKNLVYEREGRLLDGDQAAAEWIAKYAADYSS